MFRFFKFRCGCIGLEEPVTVLAQNLQYLIFRNCCSDSYDSPNADRVPFLRPMEGKQIHNGSWLSEDETMGIIHNLTDLAADGVRFRELQTLLRGK